MPFDANGNYTLPTIYIAIPGEVIKSTQHNTPFEDVQAAFNNTLCRDGRTPWTGDQNANNNKITGLAAGVNAADAVRMDQVATLDGDNTFKGKTLVQNVDDFTSQEAIPAAQADGRYIRSPYSATNDYRILTMSRNKESGGIFVIAEDGSNTQLQPAGDYAANPALNTETTNRTNADTNLQNQINNRVLKTGDTSTGSQFTSNKYDNGTLHWGPSWTSMINGLSGGSSTGDYSFGMWAQAVDSSYTAGILSLNGYQGRKDFRFNEDGNIITPLGTVALTSALPSLPGNTLQIWHVDNVQSMSTISFPRAFSSVPLGIWCQDMDGVNVDNATIRNRTNTGFQVQTGNNNTRNITFFALGYI